MATPSQILRQYLIDLGTVGDSNAAEWQSFAGPIPETDDVTDNAVGFQRSGTQQQASRGVEDGDRNPFPLVQIVVRAGEDDTAQDKGTEIETALDAIGVELPEGASWVKVLIDGKAYVIKSASVYIPLSYLGMGEKDRLRTYSINVRLDIEAETPENYRDVFPFASPALADEILGYHNGQTSRFNISDLLGLEAGDDPPLPDRVIYTNQIPGFVDDFDFAAFDAGAPVGPPAGGGCGTDNTVAVQAALTGGKVEWVNNRQALLDRLILDSVTTIRGASKSVENGVFRIPAPNSGRPMFTNRHWVTDPGGRVDKCVVVDNLYADGNRRGWGSGWTGTVTPSNPGTTAYARLVNDSAEIVPVFAFYGVDGVAVRRCHVYDPPSFGVHAANCSDVRVLDCRHEMAAGDPLNGNDALHFNGNCSDVTIDGLWASLNDDTIALNSSEDCAGVITAGSPILFQAGSIVHGPISNVTIRAVYAAASAGVVRFLTTRAVDPITDVTIKDVVATCVGRAFNFDTFTGFPGDNSFGWVDRVVARDVRITTRTNGWAAVHVAYSRLGNVEFSNLVVDGPAPAVITTNPSVIGRLLVNGVRYEGTNANAISIQTPGIAELVVRDPQYNPAAYLNGPFAYVTGTVGRIEVAGGHVSNCANLLQLAGVATGKVLVGGTAHDGSKGGATLISDTAVDEVITYGLDADLPTSFPVGTIIRADLTPRFSTLAFRDLYAGAADSNVGGHTSDSGVGYVRNVLGADSLFLTGDGFVYLGGVGTSDTVQKVASGGQPVGDQFTVEFDWRVRTAIAGGKFINVMLVGQDGLSDFLAIWLSSTSLALKYTFSADLAGINAAPAGAEVWRVRATVVRTGGNVAVAVKYSKDAGRTWLAGFGSTSHACAAANSVQLYGVSAGSGGWTKTTGIQVGGLVVMA